jgi:cobalt-precorrin 5A hydrolase
MKDENLPPEPAIAIVAVTRHGVTLALQIQSRLPGSLCYVPLRHRFALAMGARGFDRLADVFSSLWFQCRALVCIMATGIVVRQIAPLLRHKSEDPAVVVLDERGDFVISLVSGHLGGANRLAVEIAAITGGQPVVTTASDVRNRPALDLIAREIGLEIEDSAMVARLTRAFLEDEEVWVYDLDQHLAAHLGAARKVRWLSAASGSDGLPSADCVGIWVSEKLAPPGSSCLQLRPRNLVVGVGCNRGTGAEEILGLIQQVFTEAGLALASIRNLASIDIKAEEAGLVEAARRLGRPLRFFSRQDLETVEVPNPSSTVANHIGVASVCEAAALLSASDQGQSLILVPKHKTVNVTVAVARVESPS